MHEKNSGLRRMLSVPWIYEQFQNLVGAGPAKRWMAEKYWRLKGGEKVIDIGCGPGVIFDFLPKDIIYLGFDISESYIERAQAQYGSPRATFIVSTATELLRNPDPRFKDADLVMCVGLLHHLDDEQSLDVLRFAYQALKPGGRLFCVEPCYLVKHRRLSRFVMSLDRGNHLREERAWKALIGQVFPNFTTDISTALVHVPYVHIFVEGHK